MLVLLSSLSLAQAADSPVVGQGGDVVVTLEMVEAAYGPVSNIPPEEMEQMVRAVAVATVLSEQAHNEKLRKKDVWKLRLKMAQREAAARTMLEYLAEKAIKPEEIEEAWVNDPNLHEPQFRARHILVRDASALERVQHRLASGEAFGDVAREVSLDTGSGAEGGDLGWFVPEKMVPAFAEAVRVGKIGVVSDPVETRFGFHLIEVLEQRDEVPLEEAELQIRAELRRKNIESTLSSVDEQLEPFVFTAPK